MKITTRYCGPDDYRGARIIATGGGRQVTASYDYALSPAENHRRVAVTLATRATHCGVLRMHGESATGRGYRFETEGGE